MCVCALWVHFISHESFEFAVEMCFVNWNERERSRKKHMLDYLFTFLETQ